MSAKPKRTIDLRSCQVINTDESFKRKHNKPHSFQVISKEKNQSIKIIFSCENEAEYREWIDAIQSRSAASFNDRAWAKLRARRICKLAEDSFALCDPSNTGNIPCSKLKLLLECVGWTGTSAEFIQLQSKLDPELQGVVTRNRFLQWRQETKEAQNDSTATSRGNQKWNALSPTGSASSTTDWNHLYQQLFDLDEETPDQIISKGLKVSSFMGKFQSFAESTAITIVEELPLPEGLKTVKVTTAAAGTYDSVLPMPSSLQSDLHYIINGLHFHVFDVNNDLDDVSETEKDDNGRSVLVHKVLGHEIRSTRAFTMALEFVRQQKLSDLPISSLLECIVDYMGFRVFVSAIPSRSDADSGQQINSNPRVHEFLRRIAQELNVASGTEEHPAAAAYLCPDARVIQGDGNRIYVARLANLAPPDLPSPNTNEIMLLKLRPELTSNYAKPLYPGAYRNDTGALSTTRERGNLDVAEASRDLVEQVIPALADDLEHLRVLPLDSKMFTDLLHQEGINIRHTSRLLLSTRLMHVRYLVATELVARCCKSIYQTLLHNYVRNTHSSKVDALLSTRTGEKLRKTTAEQLRADTRLATVDFFNFVLGQSTDSTEFWKEKIMGIMRQKFDTYKPSFNLMTDIHRPQLFWALQYHLRVRFSDKLSYNFNSSKPLRLEDLVCLELSSKITTRTLSSCEDLIQSVETSMEEGDFESALLGLKVNMSVEESCPSRYATIQAGVTLLRAAQVSLQMNNLTEAEKYAAAARDETPKSHVFSAKCRLVMMEIKHRLNSGLDEDLGLMSSLKRDFEHAKEVIQWHLGVHHPLLYQVYLTMVNILQDRRMIQEAIEMLDEGTTILSKAFGSHHILMAEPRCRQGELLALGKQEEKAITMYEDALRIYDNKMEDQEQQYESGAATCCYHIAALHIRINSHEKAFKFALRGLSLRDAASASTDVVLDSVFQLAELSELLFEYLRAIQYYKRALSILKTQNDQESVEEVRSLTQSVIQLYFKCMSPEKRLLLEKHRREETNNEFEPSQSVIPFVVSKLFSTDPVEYLDGLFDQIVESSGVPVGEHTCNQQLSGILRLVELNEAP